MCVVIVAAIYTHLLFITTQRDILGLLSVLGSLLEKWLCDTETRVQQHTFDTSPRNGVSQTVMN